MRLEISRQILKNTQISYIMKIRWEPSCFMRTDRRTGRETDRQDNLVVAFHSFANASSNGDERQHVAVRIDISVAFDADYWSKDNANKDYLNRPNKECVTDDDLNIINSKQPLYAHTIYIITQFMFPRRVFGGHRPSSGSSTIKGKQMVRPAQPPFIVCGWF